jgi:hypothetical protein
LRSRDDFLEVAGAVTAEKGVNVDNTFVLGEGVVAGRHNAL